MTGCWPAIIERYHVYAGDDPAVLAIRNLAERIGETKLSDQLYGWTSIYDLCLSHSPATQGQRCPTLRLHPHEDGLVEFRFIDIVPNHYWSRSFPPDVVFPRTLHVLESLRWCPSDALETARHHRTATA